jgi:hypothetical protein
MEHAESLGDRIEIHSLSQAEQDQAYRVDMILVSRASVSRHGTQG